MGVIGLPVALPLLYGQKGPVAPAVLIPSALTISGTPGAATAGAAYSFIPSTSGGSGTKTFTIAGSLPAGMSFSPATGAVSGTPTIVGTTTGLNITVTDATASASLGVFSLTVGASAQVPAAPALALTSGNGQLTIAWTDGSNGGAAITSHKLYRGATSGAETLLGNVATASPYVDTGLTNGVAYFYKLSAVNSIGESALSIEQSRTPFAPLVLSGTPGSAAQNSPYTFTPTVAGGYGAKSYTLAGSLPTGLSFSTTTGAISGTPTVAGTTAGLNITVTDASGSASLGAFSLVVSAAPPASPALTWVSDSSALNPTMNVVLAPNPAVGDVVAVQVSTASDFSTIFGTGTATLTSTNVTNGTCSPTGFPTLSYGNTYYARAKLTRGGVASAWSASVSKVMDAVDSAPGPFGFTDVTGATLSTLYTSNTITPTAFNSPTTASVTGGTISINGSAFGAGETFFNPGDTIAARATSSGANSTPVNVVVTIGGVSDTYTVTTAAAAGGGALAYTQTASPALRPLGNSGGLAITFAAQNIGAASADRIVNVELIGFANASTVVTGITVGGISLAKKVGIDPSANAGAICEEWARLLTATDIPGSSADIVITATDTAGSNPWQQIGISVGTIKGSATASVSGTATKNRSYTSGTATASAALVVPTGGLIKAAAFEQGTTATGITGWGTGMTADYTPALSGTFIGSFGHSTGTGSITPAVTFNQDGNNGLAAAVWSP